MSCLARIGEWRGLWIRFRSFVVRMCGTVLPFSDSIASFQKDNSSEYPLLNPLDWRAYLSARVCLRVLYQRATCLYRAVIKHYKTALFLLGLLRPRNSCDPLHPESDLSISIESFFLLAFLIERSDLYFSQLPRPRHTQLFCDYWNPSQQSARLE